MSYDKSPLLGVKREAGVPNAEHSTKYEAKSFTQARSNINHLAPLHIHVLTDPDLGSQAPHTERSNVRNTLRRTYSAESKRGQIIKKKE